jgi:SHS family lactate transporter-like MFS transporter
MITGYISQFLGRRLSIVLMCIVGGALLYPYTFATANGRYAAGFFIQFCVQGSWGVVPIYLIEMSPIAFRTLVVGLSYQVGVFFASPSNTIITAIAKRIPTHQEGTGNATYNYSIAISAFIGTIFICTIVVAALGPEIQNKEIAKPSNQSDEEHGSNLTEIGGPVGRGGAELG